MRPPLRFVETLQALYQLRFELLTTCLFFTCYASTNFLSRTLGRKGLLNAVRKK